MSVIIRLQNLPWNANALDIRGFFRSLSIPDGGVHIIGGEKGEAFIAFSTDEDARQAMMLSERSIHDIPVKLFLSSKTEMQNIIAEARNVSAVKPLELDRMPTSGTRSDNSHGLDLHDHRGKGFLENRGLGEIGFSRNIPGSSIESSRQDFSDARVSAKPSGFNSAGFGQGIPNHAGLKSRDIESNMNQPDFNSRQRGDDFVLSARNRDRPDDDRMTQMPGSFGVSSDVVGMETDFRKQSAASSDSGNVLPAAQRKAMENSVQYTARVRDKHLEAKYPGKLRDIPPDKFSGWSDRSDEQRAVGRMSSPIRGKPDPFGIVRDVEMNDIRMRDNGSKYQAEDAFGMRANDGRYQKEDAFSRNTFSREVDRGHSRSMERKTTANSKDTMRLNMDHQGSRERGLRQLDFEFMNQTERGLFNKSESIDRGRDYADADIRPLLRASGRELVISDGPFVEPVGREWERGFHDSRNVLVVPDKNDFIRQNVQECNDPRRELVLDFHPVRGGQEIQDNFQITSNAYGRNNFDFHRRSPTALFQGRNFNEQELLVAQHHVNMPTTSSITGNQFGMGDRQLFDDDMGNEGNQCDIVNPDISDSWNVMQFQGNHLQESRRSETDFCIRISNLPTTFNYREIRRLLGMCQIPKTGIKIVNNELGMRAGVAYIQFEDAISCDRALAKNWTLVSNMKITVELCSIQEYDEAIDSFVPPKNRNVSNRSRSPLNRKALVVTEKDFCIVMKKLPPNVVIADIAKFLKNIQIAHDGGPFIEIAKDGHKTGNVLVAFTRERDFQEAMRRNRMELYGSRVSLIPITHTEYSERVIVAKARQSEQNQVPSNSDVLPNERGRKPSKFDTSGNMNVNPDKMAMQDTEQSGTTFCVEVIGLQTPVTFVDIDRFFQGIQIVKNGIHVYQQNRSIIAFVEFPNKAEQKKALAKDKRYIKGQCVQIASLSLTLMMNKIETLEATNHEGGNDKSGQISADSVMVHTVKIKNLPFTTQLEDILLFFHGLTPVTDSIKLQYKDGRPTGEGLIAFHTAQEAAKAINEFNRKKMGGRPLLLSTLVATNDEDCNDKSGVLIADDEKIGVMVHTVKMQNLPFTTQLEDILDFFHGLTPVTDSIKLQYKDGRPTGAGLIAFHTAEEAAKAINFNRKKLHGRPLILSKSDIQLPG